MLNSNFLNNSNLLSVSSSQGGGSAIVCVNTTINCDNCTFSHNHVEQGSCVFSTDGFVHLNNSKLIQNSNNAGGYGTEVHMARFHTQKPLTGTVENSYFEIPGRRQTNASFDIRNHSVVIIHNNTFIGTAVCAYLLISISLKVNTAVPMNVLLCMITTL